MYIVNKKRITKLIDYIKSHKQSPIKKKQCINNREVIMSVLLINITLLDLI